MLIAMPYKMKNICVPRLESAAARGFEQKKQKKMARIEVLLSAYSRHHSKNSSGNPSVSNVGT